MEVTMTYVKPIAIILAVICFASVVPVSGQQSSETGAELSVIPIGRIPLITPNKETFVSLRYTDNFGMNWTRLQYFYGNTGVRALMSFVVTRVIWPIIHPTWKPFLGYTSVKFAAEVVGNPPGWTVSINPSTIPQSTDGTTADLQLSVFLNDLTAENTVTIRVSATRILKDGKTEYGTSYFEIPVRPAKLNYVDIKPDASVKEVSPDSMVTFQIDITNRGYFVDTFAAKVRSDNEVKGTLSQQSFVLQPGETRQVTLRVMTTDLFFDPGTTHTLDIEAYSLNYPQNIFTGSVQVRTRGMYISPLVLFGMVMMLLIFVVVFLIFYYVVGKRNQNLYGVKPDKPWTIPEERQYLEELKVKDKKEYQKVLQMMDEEYQSAILWYNDYCRTIKQERCGIPQKASEEQNHEKKAVARLFKRKGKKPEELPVEKPTRQQSKEIPQFTEVVDAEPLEVQRQKEKTLRKIQHEQKKQQRKFK